jgi:hypothetical protein
MNADAPGIYDADLPPLTLRRTDVLARVPAVPNTQVSAPVPSEPDRASAAATPDSPASQAEAASASQPASPAPTAPAPQASQSLPAASAAKADSEQDRSLPTVALAGMAVTVAAAGFFWLSRRKKLRALREQHDSEFWAKVQPASSSIRELEGPSTEQFAGFGPAPINLDDILPDSPDPGEAARAIYVTAIGETTSRREATLIDLHQLERRLTKRLKRGKTAAATLLLQEHLVDFRYTSPWVFLELLELYRVLNKQTEWNIARHAFRSRFGQNAPLWMQPTTLNEDLPSDPALLKELQNIWPNRTSRIWILRWVLGDHHMRDKAGPPLLGLGTYRDLMFLDSLLDELMPARST